jgi:gliding motility-associated protein GldL
MSDYSKFNIIYRLQKWMDSVPGQTFLNYGYSWGASVVILGALFKLTHLPGANIMLFIGMGTEVVVFFLSAFDRPFDKTDDGKNLPTHVTEKYLETGEVEYDEAHEHDENVAPVAPATSVVASVATDTASDENSGTAMVSTVVNHSSEWVSQQAKATPEMAEAQNSYVEELNKLVETLGKVNEQSTRLTRDSEEMENLNRTLTGITKIYEMQLKGASQQVGTIDQINDQTRKMAQQIEQLNKIYARMIEAMTVNMRAAAPGAASVAQSSTEESL